MIGVIVFLGLLMVIAGSIRLWYSHRNHGRLFQYVWYTRVPMRKRDCVPCGGLGVQYWDGKKWGIIPKHLRAATKGRNYLKTNLGNVKTCGSCRGIGFNWERYLIGHKNGKPAG